MHKQAYGFDIRWSEEDQAFLATCPSFPQFSAFGGSRQEALEEAETALGLVLEEYEAQRVAPPVPAELIVYSGQFRFRPGKVLHAALAAEAERQGVSLNQLTTTLVAQGLSRLDVLAQLLTTFQQAAHHMQIAVSTSAAIHRDTVRRWDQLAVMASTQEAGGPFQAEDLNRIVRANSLTHSI